MAKNSRPVSSKSPPLSKLINQAAKTAGVPPALFRSLIINGEGSYHGWETSPAGAQGPSQLMPGTAKGLEQRYHINTKTALGNLLGGAYYLREQLERFGGDARKAVAAYNAGPGAVSKYGGVPPYGETQRYVSRVLGGKGTGVLSAALTAPSVSQAGTPAAGSPSGAPVPTNPILQAQQIYESLAPSQQNVDLISRGGELSGRVAAANQGGQLYDPGIIAQLQQQQLQQSQQPLQGVGAADQGGGGGEPQPVMPLSGYLSGDIPMTTGGQSPYSNIKFADQVDWHHVNPRLLKAINAEAKKYGVVANVISGYRSNQYSQQHGGFAHDPHTKGIAVDAYIGGHPIGDVISAEEWAKHGVRSGNQPNFYQGKSDPEHLDLVGIPIKKKK